MSNPSGNAEVRCAKCHGTFSIDASDINVDEVASEERNMGAEIFYEGISEFSCPKCGNEIEVKYEASEYPVGALNYSETNATGANIVRGFKDIDVSFQDEMYSFEEESRLYLPEDKKIITCLTLGVSDMIQEISRNPDNLYQIDPRKLEELIAHIFSRHGFSVELTKQTRDGGRDIIAIRSDLGIRSKYIIECKRYSHDNPVRVDLVRNLYGVQMQEGANKSVLATTSYFTPDAKKFSEAKNTTEWSMDLKAFDDIYKWIKESAAANNSLKGTR